MECLHISKSLKVHDRFAWVSTVSVQIQLSVLLLK